MANDDIARPHVWRPAGNPGEARTLLLLHGTGADEYDLLNLGKALDPHANLLSPRGMYLESGMNRFFERYPDGTFNEVSIAENTDELARFLAAAVSHYGFRADQVWAAGFSNGANAAAALLMLHPASLRGIVSFGTTRPFANPATRLFEERPLLGKSVIIANGRQDPYAPIAATELMAKEFGDWGAEVLLLEHPGGHSINPEHVRVIAEKLSGIS